MISCKDEHPDHVEFDCGGINTAIIDRSPEVGSFVYSAFSSMVSVDLEKEVIALPIDDFAIVSETTSYATFTALLQLLEYENHIS